MFMLIKPNVSILTLHFQGSKFRDITILGIQIREYIFIEILLPIFVPNILLEFVYLFG